MLKPRPLTRDKATFKDDRMILIACDDTFAPKQYFSFFDFRRAKIRVVETTDGTSAAEHVLERLLEYAFYPDDERWLVLDSDHMCQGTHLASLTRALKKARQHKVNIAISKPCFEFWLLLHHEADLPALAALRNASDVIHMLRAKLGHFNKTALRKEDFSLELVKAAIKVARVIDRKTLGGTIPSSNTTRVYKVWEAIVAIEAPTA